MAKKDHAVRIQEVVAWVVIRKSNGDVVTAAGIEFEKTHKVCPTNIMVNPIYKDEYYNKRIMIIV